MNFFSKVHIFLYFTLTIGFFVLYKTYPPKPALLLVEISQQNGDIKTIDTVKQIKSKLKYKLNSLNFTQSNTLQSKKYGRLGFSQNFFIRARVNLLLKTKGMYDFAVTSDDGFRLKIDNKLLCEFKKGRAYKKTTCSITLLEGTHLFDLEYFQGKGPMGLRAEYALHGDAFKIIGEENKIVTFTEYKID